MNQGFKLHQLKRAVHNDQHMLRNHLLSILKDSATVDEMKSVFPSFPSFGNLRSGAWYSCNWDDLCYFKSTDGHHGQWGFSLARLNLNVAKRAIEAHGCQIFDSTASGKRFPDSLSATVPIWCIIINNIVLGDTPPITWEFPPWIDESQRSLLVPTVQKLLNNVPSSVQCVIRESLSGLEFKPLRPVWVCKDSDDMLEWMGTASDALMDFIGGEANEIDFVPILLVSVSSDISAAEHSAHHS
eukprot:gene57749-77080_t